MGADQREGTEARAPLVALCVPSSRPPRLLRGLAPPPTRLDLLLLSAAPSVPSAVPEPRRRLLLRALALAPPSVSIASGMAFCSGGRRPGTRGVDAPRALAGAAGVAFGVEGLRGDWVARGERFDGGVAVRAALFFASMSGEPSTASDCIPVGTGDAGIGEGGSCCRPASRGDAGCRGDPASRGDAGCRGEGAGCARCGTILLVPTGVAPLLLLLLLMAGGSTCGGSTCRGGCSPPKVCLLGVTGVDARAGVDCFLVFFAFFFFFALPSPPSPLIRRLAVAGRSESAGGRGRGVVGRTARPREENGSSADAEERLEGSSLRPSLPIATSTPGVFPCRASASPCRGLAGLALEGVRGQTGTVDDELSMGGNLTASLTEGRARALMLWPCARGIGALAPRGQRTKCALLPGPASEAMSKAAALRLEPTSFGRTRNEKKDLVTFSRSRIDEIGVGEI